MHNERSLLKKGVLALSIITIAGAAGVGYWYTAQSAPQDYYIYEFNDDERDIRDVEKLFEKDFYWLTTRDSYDVRAMLTRRTSEFTNPNVNNNMWIYLMRDKATDKLIGFGTFFKLSFYKGQILFVSIDESFRGKRYGQKVAQFMLDKMKEMGMVKAALFTRLDNKAARRLYERMGFKESSRVDNVGLYYDIYL